MLLTNEEEDKEPERRKRRKLTTAADVKLQMKMAEKDSNNTHKKEIQKLRSVYTAYMKHALLRPILDSELGTGFFKRIPSSKDELEFKLSEIRQVFNRAGVHDNIIQIILTLSYYAEQLPPELCMGHNISGLSMAMLGEIEDMKQEIAELECEYGGYLEAGLAMRVFKRFARVVKLVSTMNENQTIYSQTVQPQTTTDQAVKIKKPQKKNKKNVSFDV